MRSGFHNEGNHSCGWIGHPALSRHARRFKAASAGLRQADDLLPAEHADARRACATFSSSPRRRTRTALRSCSATESAGASTSATPCSPAPTAWRRPSSSAATSSAATPARSSWATTSSTGSHSLRELQRAAAIEDGAHGFCISRARSRTLRRRRVRQDAAARSASKRNPQAPKVALRRHRPLFLRQRCSEARRVAQSPRRAASSRSPISTGSISTPAS